MITILGGGMGGLLLAAILGRNGVSCRVLEADACASSRHQGGMLNINEGAGQDALRLAGLREGFEQRALPGGDGTKISDRTGQTLFADPGNGTRPEIDRGSLRTLLLSAIEPDVIGWDHKVQHITARSDGFRLTFADGNTESVDTLIGADGANSKVRALLTNAQPVYSGISFVEYRYLNADTAWPKALELIGDGLFFGLGDGRGFIGHREPNHELCVYAAITVPEDWSGGSVNRDDVARFFTDWSPTYLQMIAASDGDPVIRPIHALPIGTRWEPKPGVTLLGDAAHLMSPFAGEGVNLALADAAELATAILEAPHDIDAAFTNYEAQLFARVEPIAQNSADNLRLAFAPDAPKPFLDFFNSIGLGQQHTSPETSTP